MVSKELIEKAAAEKEIALSKCEAALRMLGDIHFKELTDWLNGLNADQLQSLLSDPEHLRCTLLSEKLYSRFWKGYPGSACAVLAWEEQLNILPLVFLDGSLVSTKAEIDAQVDKWWERYKDDPAVTQCTSDFKLRNRAHSMAWNLVHDYLERGGNHTIETRSDFSSATGMWSLRVVVAAPGITESTYIPRDYYVR